MAKIDMPLTDAQRAELAQGILQTSANLQIRPEDLATTIGYETAGTFDPWKAGPTTRWGQHRGLVQWGEPQARQYGVTRDTTIGDQLKAVERYLRDRGLKPGSGLLDIYSTVNAGSPGRYDARDINGSVRENTARAQAQFGDAFARLTGGIPAVAATNSPQPPPAPSDAVTSGPRSRGDTFDPSIAAMFAEQAPDDAPAQPDPREERRRALLSSIGQLFIT